MATKTATPFADRVKAARKEAKLSTIESAYQLRDYLPQSLWKSYQWIHRLETGAIDENDADPVVLAGLARVWNTPLVELSPDASESRAKIVRLLVTEESKKRGSSTPRKRNGPGRDRLGGTRPGRSEHPGLPSRAERMVA